MGPSAISSLSLRLSIGEPSLSGSLLLSGVPMQYRSLPTVIRKLCSSEDSERRLGERLRLLLSPCSLPRRLRVPPDPVPPGGDDGLRLRCGDGERREEPRWPDGERWRRGGEAPVAAAVGDGGGGGRPRPGPGPDVLEREELHLSCSVPTEGWKTSWLVCVEPPQKIHSLCGFMAELAIALISWH